MSDIVTVDHSVIERRIARAERFYSRLRAKVAAWLERRRVRGPLREYLLLLPDFFALVIRLLRDPRVESGLKAQLLAASAYVITPLDFVPDILAPLGLADDTIVLALIISRVAALLGQAGGDVLTEHWEGEGDVLEQVRRVLGAADRVVNHRIVNILRRRFGKAAA